MGTQEFSLMWYRSKFEILLYSFYMYINKCSFKNPTNISVVWSTLKVTYHFLFTSDEWPRHAKNL